MIVKNREMKDLRKEILSKFNTHMENSNNNQHVIAMICIVKHKSLSGSAPFYISSVVKLLKLAKISSMACSSLSNLSNVQAF